MERIKLFKMKKRNIIILALMLFIGQISVVAQTYSGSTVVNAGSNMSISITVDPSADTLQITMTGPSSVYYSYGFGSNMMVNTYCFVTTGTGMISERKLGNHNSGSLLASSLINSSFASLGGFTTTSVSRSISGMNSDYFTFPAGANTIIVMWAYGFGPNLGSHDNRGVATINLTQDCIETYSTVNQNSCGSFVSFSGNYTWTSSGTYFDTIPNTAGCDSVITVNLTINTIDTSVSLSGYTLTANASGASYQWLDCDNNFLAIAGETNQSLSVTNSGNYAVEISLNNCIDTSNCYNIITTEIIEDLFEKEITYYPNPNNGTFNIHLGNNSLDFEIVVSNVFGQNIGTYNYTNANHAKIRIDDSPGLYYVKILTKQNSPTILKVIKE
jgi:hypothetical protein